MPRRKLGEQHIRKLAKSKSSYYLTLPLEAVKQLEWQKFQKLVVEFDTRRKRLIVRDWKP